MVRLRPPKQCELCGKKLYTATQRWKHEHNHKVDALMGKQYPKILYYRHQPIFMDDMDSTVTSVHYVYFKGAE